MTEYPDQPCGPSDTRGLVDECLTEWLADSQPDVQAIVTGTFNADQKEWINRAKAFMLLHRQIEDLS